MKCIYSNKELIGKCLTCLESKPNADFGECIYCGYKCNGEEPVLTCDDYIKYKE